MDSHKDKPRTIIDIERAAKLTVEENRRFGPRFVKWKPYPEMAHQTSAERSPTAEGLHERWGILAAAVCC